MSSIKSIKCTNCAAPLELLGGGRVQSITCKYCKSVLDLNDNYHVLSHFKNIKELRKLPFEVGMRGDLKGIDYTIIGRITYADSEYPHNEWTDFLLFSPLFGYAYLTYEEGHLIYSKRERRFPNLAWSQIAQYTTIVVNNKPYTPFDSYEAKVVYVEGELTWIAKRDDKTSFIDLIQPPFGISVEKSKDAIEYYKMEYLDHDTTYKAFKAKKEEPPKDFHPLQPFKRPFLKSLSQISYWAMFIIALLALAITINGSGKTIKQIVTNNQQRLTTEFNITTDRYLVNIELEAKRAKELNNFILHIQKDKELIFSLAPNGAYINSGSKQLKELKSWERGAIQSRILLNLDKANHYMLTITPINSSLDSTLLVTIKEAYSKLDYFKYLFALSVLFWSLYKLLAWRYANQLKSQQGIYHEIETITENKSSSLGITFYLIIFALFIIFTYQD